MIPFTECRAFLLGHVTHVFCMSGQEQVRRVDAQPDVASMSDFYSCRDLSVGQFPRDAMSLCHPFLDAEVAVTVSGGSSPYPAVARFINLRPEARLTRNLPSVERSIIDDLPLLIDIS
jgi:hypothetical protein